VASAPPAIILLPESARRMQEMMALMQQGTVSFPEDHVLLVNTAHPLMQKLIELDSSQVLVDGKSESADLANLICTHVYDLALMAQKSFDADSMKGFLQRSNQLLTKLTSKI
jgi:molecular chaperone HtpG